MKHILLLLIITVPLLLTRFTARGEKINSNESEAQTYLKLFTTVTGTADNKQENWLLTNNGTRRILATIEIVSTPAEGSALKETKNIVVEPGNSVPLGLRSSNGSAPNTIVIIKAVFTQSV